MDGPFDVIIAPHSRGQASMGDHHSEGICRGTPTTPEGHGSGAGAMGHGGARAPNFWEHPGTGGGQLTSVAIIMLSQM